MDEKTKGFILKLTDYKDADKLASIFTFEYGVVTAKFVGVKKEKAKLKSFAQPFTFADFNFTKRANSRVVSGVNLIDNFYPILADYNKTICGYILLDTIKSLLPPEKVEQDLFLLAISSLKDIEQKNEFVATIDFLIKFLNFSGFAINFPKTRNIYFDKYTGEFTINKTSTCVQIDKHVYETFMLISDGEIQEFNINILKQILRLIKSIISIHFGEEIKSFDFI